MTFIIALGVIIVLLCSASVFKLMQPKQDATTKRNKQRHSGGAAASHHAKSRSHKHKAQKPKPAAATPTPAMGNVASVQSEPVITPAPVAAKAAKAAKPQTAAQQPAQPIKPAPKLISLNLCAVSDKPYAGYELLQSLLSCGMRFGAMSIFHRHEKKTGVGPILFSLASCTKDGTFDLAKIGAFSCNGLVLFMKPHEVGEPVRVFELMLETADQLINDLGGKVLNEKQQLLKKEDVLTVHQQLKQYEKDRNTMDLFD